MLSTKRQATENAENVSNAAVYSFMKEINGKLDALQKDLGTRVTSAESSIKAMQNTLVEFQKAHVRVEQTHQRLARRTVQFEGSFQSKLQWRYGALHQLRLRRLRFYNVDKMAKPSTSSAPTLSDQVSYACDRVKLQLEEVLGRQLPNDIFGDAMVANYTRKDAQDKQMLVVTLPDTKWLGTLGSCRRRMKEKFGLTWSMELTPEEIAAQAAIKKHPAFVRALGKAPAGTKVYWQYDSCTIGRPTPSSEVWNLQRLEQLGDGEQMVID